MRWNVVLAICTAIAGCCLGSQPESLRAVAAFEIPLPLQQDREQFMTVLSTIAKAEGLHVESASQEWLEHVAQTMPDAERTIQADVWRDDKPEASIMDWHDHLGQVWVIFSKGEDPALASRFRERAMQEVLLRWPDTLSLPIMPTGAIPLHRDLIRTSTGYIVDPAAAPRYQLEDPENGRS